MLSVLLSMTVFALIGAITPGPVNVIATSTSANFGFKRTLPHIIGASVSYAFIVFIVGIGFNAVLKNHPQITELLRYLGATFLFYMAYKIATSVPSSESVNNTDTPPRWLDGVLAQALNPKAWLVSMSGVTLFVSSQSPASTYLMIFTLISLVICLVGVGTWAAAGHLIYKLLSKPHHYVMLNRAMGLLLSITVLLMLFT
jgi:threonine/homoserine/homoserine lactone efflux protein